MQETIQYGNASAANEALSTDSAQPHTTFTDAFGVSHQVAMSDGSAAPDRTPLAPPEWNSQSAKGYGVSDASSLGIDAKPSGASASLRNRATLGKSSIFWGTALAGLSMASITVGILCALSVIAAPVVGPATAAIVLIAVGAALLGAVGIGVLRHSKQAPSDNQRGPSGGSNEVPSGAKRASSGRLNEAPTAPLQKTAIANPNNVESRETIAIKNNQQEKRRGRIDLILDKNQWSGDLRTALEEGLKQGDDGESLQALVGDRDVEPLRNEIDVLAKTHCRAHLRHHRERCTNDQITELGRQWQESTCNRLKDLARIEKMDDVELSQEVANLQAALAQKIDAIAKLPSDATDNKTTDQMSELLSGIQRDQALLEEVYKGMKLEETPCRFERLTQAIHDAALAAPKPANEPVDEQSVVQAYTQSLADAIVKPTHPFNRLFQETSAWYQFHDGEVYSDTRGAMFSRKRECEQIANSVECVLNEIAAEQHKNEAPQPDSDAESLSGVDDDELVSDFGPERIPVDLEYDPRQASQLTQNYGTVEHAVTYDFAASAGQWRRWYGRR